MTRRLPNAQAAVPRVKRTFQPSYSGLRARSCAIDQGVSLLHSPHGTRAGPRRRCILRGQRNCGCFQLLDADQRAARSSFRRSVARSPKPLLPPLFLARCSFRLGMTTSARSKTRGRSSNACEFERRFYFFIALANTRAAYRRGQYKNFDAHKKNSLAVVGSMAVRLARKIGVSIEP